jgi:hypothetical protein
MRAAARLHITLITGPVHHTSSIAPVHTIAAERIASFVDGGISARPVLRQTPTRQATL